MQAHRSWNNETFYIGKGKGDRVFSHVRGEQKIEGDEPNNKMKRIRQYSNIRHYSSKSISRPPRLHCISQPVFLGGNKAKAEQAEVILANLQGLIFGAFMAHK